MATVRAVLTLRGQYPVSFNRDRLCRDLLALTISPFPGAARPIVSERA